MMIQCDNDSFDGAAHRMKNYDCGMMQRHHVTKAYIENLRVYPNWTVSHVVPLRIAKTGLKILLDVLERAVCACIELSLDFVEGDGPFNELIVVGVLPFGRQTHKVV